ncbi:hypothetical protein FHR87_003527 [Azomonas macrocytogenes]|uniref:Uncharacterized protein n=1 Tax=Azomonas macrocytogenes TaxID=69962 RepID=A0A839TBX2_AZOMA|nr:hypothetical protein [Azomonas macrocytogenes]
MIKFFGEIRAADPYQTLIVKTLDQKTVLLYVAVSESWTYERLQKLPLRALSF